MALFDLPYGLLSWLDEAAARLLSPLMRIVCWALITALLAMEIYRRSSPQHRLSRLKQEFRDTERNLNNYAGSLTEAWPLLGRLLGLSLQRIWLVVPATLLTGIPVLILLLWLSTTYGYRFPEPRESISVTVSNPGYQGRWEPQDSRRPGRALVTDGAGKVVLEFTPTAAVPVISKWRPWNLLLGNPAGYLPARAPIEAIQLSLPRQELIAAGPPWIRGWEFSFFGLLLLFGLLLKVVRGIE